MEIKILLEQALNNDQRAYAALMDKYKNAIRNMVYKLVANKEDAEDITIETFSKAFDNLQNYSEQYAFSTWIFKIASNAAIDHLRKKNIRKISLEQNNAISNNIQYSTNETPEFELIIRQRKNKIHEYLNKLDAHHREIISLRYFDELSYDEIAAQLHTSLANVKVQLHRAKKALAKIFENEEDW
jgi:RNA polymerase sigma-70 factor (ECF subfamily)